MILVPRRTVRFELPLVRNPPLDQSGDKPAPSRMRPASSTTKQEYSASPLRSQQNSRAVSHRPKSQLALLRPSCFSVAARVRARVAIAPIVIRFNTTACCVRRSSWKSASWRRACGRRSPEAADRQPSYRLGFPKDSFAHSRGQVLGREEINPNAQRFFEVCLQSSQVKQCSSRVGVNQQIQVAAFPIIATENRAEHARVADRAERDDSPNGFAILSEDF